MTTVFIQAPGEITKPTAIGGLSSATWNSITLWGSRGFKVVDDFDNDRAGIVIDRDYVDLPAVDGWCSLNSEITNYECWHELSDPNALCPYSQTSETWNQWEVSGQSGVPVQIGAYWYRSNQQFASQQGKPLEASVWYPYINNPQNAAGLVRILTVEEYQAIIQAQAAIDAAITDIP